MSYHSFVFYKIPPALSRKNGVFAKKVKGQRPLQGFGDSVPEVLIFSHQPSRFLQPQYNVHVLHRRTRRTLAEVVKYAH